MTTTPAQTAYLADLAADPTSRGAANRRDAVVARALQGKGLITITSDGVRLTDDGRVAAEVARFNRALAQHSRPFDARVWAEATERASRT